MFCYHCQEAKKNLVCDKAGICGKKENVSSLQDMLMYSLKGLAFYSHAAEEFGLVSNKTHQFIAKALFSMVTNVNFAPADFLELISQAVKRRNTIREQFLAAYQDKHGQAFDQVVPDEAQWQYDAIDEKAFTDKGASIGVEHYAETVTEDVLALQECLLYAVKGLGALAVHNLSLGLEDDELSHFMQQALAFSLNSNNGLDDILTLTLRSGELGLKAMAALETANSKQFGHPEPTTVHLDTWDKPGILVSGHDLQDIEDLLVQTAGTGIDIYTHGEAISAHAYPALKKYFNLVANYGNAWQAQKTEFPKFNGPILVTTNSVQQPKKTYQDKLFTTGMVAWPEVTHIADRKPGQRKDFSQLIAVAKQSDAPNALTEGQTVTGYGVKALLGLTDKIAQAIKDNKISQIVVIAGTDGRHKERSYYTELAETLAADTLIITAGDTKYRFYQHEFGEIEGIPRYLDAGQSNDFAAVITFLKQLQQTLGLAELNDLPVSFNIAWYEQKTILMMLSLFALGLKNVRIGPTLPPFFTPHILEVLTEKYALKGIDTVEVDIASIMAGH